MIFIDTNYWLRYLLNDDDKKHAEAANLFREAATGQLQICTSVLALFETKWVLTSFYNQEKADVSRVLGNILAMKFIILPEREIMNRALIVYQTKSLELEDCYHLVFARQLGCRDIATFDRKLKKEFSKVN